MDRENLKELRPEIHSARKEGTTDMEHFQNALLRPVIKFQHDLILGLVQHHAHFDDLIKNKGPRTDFQLRVQQFVTKQNELKNQLIGCVLGNFTLEEFAEYRKNSNEHNKRIIQMIVQRVTDTVY
jgi:hypothetical protein